MNKIDSYKSYPLFLKDLESKIKYHVPFKFFGPKSFNKNKNAYDFHSLSAMGITFMQTENPENSPTIGAWKAPYGEIFKYGCRLDPDTTFTTKITPNAAGANRFQGDIFELDHEVAFNVATKYVMVLSHSCDIENSKTINVLPVYLNDALKSNLGNASVLRGETVKNPLSVNNWVSNNNKLFVGLPPFDLNGTDVNFLIYLNGQSTFAKDSLPTNPVCRLSYRSLMYLQMRSVHFYFRDVIDSDESRDL